MASALKLINTDGNSKMLCTKKQNNATEINFY